VHVFSLLSGPHNEYIGSPLDSLILVHLPHAWLPIVTNGVNKQVLQYIEETDNSVKALDSLGHSFLYGTILFR